MFGVRRLPEFRVDCSYENKHEKHGAVWTPSFCWYLFKSYSMDEE